LTNLVESKMVPYAWKFHESNDGVEYNIQFVEVPWKFRKALFDAMKDWSRIGVGWTKSTGNQIFIFRKCFKTESEWQKWASVFPMQIHETKFWGEKQKVVIHGKKKTK
jgi:hypothetical protein